MKNNHECHTDLIEQVTNDFKGKFEASGCQLYLKIHFEKEE